MQTMLVLMKRLALGLFALIGVLLVLVLLYFAAADALLLMPANSKTHSQPIAVTAYVIDNGVHTDFVFPIATQSLAWSWARTFPKEHFQKVPRDAAYVAIGWGDREFYLNTPEWKDLTAERALHALAGSGSSLMHVSYLRESDLPAKTYEMPLTAAQYDALVRHIEGTLVRAGNGQGVNLPDQHYGRQDAFYEARGSYNAFTTCNVWTGLGLLRAGVTVSAWTPLASQVVWHLPRRQEVR